MRPRYYWPITIAAAALIGLLAYGLVAKGSDTSIDQAIADGRTVAAPVATLPRLERGRGRLARPVPRQAGAAQRVGLVVPAMQGRDAAARAHPPAHRRRRRDRARDRRPGRPHERVRFLRAKGVTFPSLRDRDRTYVHSLGVTGYPESFLIDRHGKIVALNRGPLVQRGSTPTSRRSWGRARDAARRRPRRAGARCSPPAAALAATPRTSLPDVEDEVMCVECGTALDVSQSPVANRSAR